MGLHHALDELLGLDGLHVAGSVLLLHGLFQIADDLVLAAGDVVLGQQDRKQFGGFGSHSWDFLGFALVNAFGHVLPRKREGRDWPPLLVG
jgi:hypothetical protein